ncbi:GNAT family N-acetyltransferase [Jatrophihabitans sp.]|jgi:ribosomal protein S18 acetylase RimI-like enzyme|uniref:GNAT family N-acetyltransferase n=1 Tax=Jatrophihabitans sp. TaxID=1932789 RepID=UPI0032C235B9
MTRVAIELSTPSVDQLVEVVNALRSWQVEGLTMQLHPGDLGWNWQFGAEATAAALRTWSRDGRIVGIGFLDSPEVLRMTVAPEVRHDAELAREVVSDLSDPRRGVLPAGKASVESPNGTRVQEILTDTGWSGGEAWTPLRRDLAEPVETEDLRVDVIGLAQVSEFTEVHRSAWDSARFTDDRWHAMADGAPFADARCLLAYDDQGVAVGGVTVWSAGAGRPGLIEPLGIHAAHRGRGYARAICRAAAAELRALGSTSALVCTPSARAAAVATYRSAGFERAPERLDRTRDD